MSSDETRAALSSRADHPLPLVREHVGLAPAEATNYQLGPCAPGMKRIGAILPLSSASLR